MEQFLITAREALPNPYIQASIVLALSLIVAKLADFVISRGILAVTRRTATTLDDRIVERLHHPIFLSVILFGLFLVQGILKLPDPYKYVTVAFLKTMAILIWSTLLLRVSHLILDAISRRGGGGGWIEARTAPLLDNLGKLAIICLAIYMLLVSWDLDVKPWLASAGIAGIAIGFAAKDTLANLFGGLFIVADAPYKIGDYIVLDTGERGMVTQIGLRSTRLLTRDDVEITLPNAQIANSKIVNESGGPYEKARITVTVGVAYGSDVDQVRRVLLEAADGVEEVVKEPAPRVRFTEFGDSALIFRLLAWVHQPAQRGVAIDELHTQVYKRFNAAGIQIPFPQRDVHIKQAPGA